MRHRNSTSILSLLVICAILVTIIYVDLPGRLMLWAEIQNAGHALAFGIFAIALLIFLRNTLTRRNHAQLIYYLLSLGISAIAGVGTEIVQHFQGRDAEVVDIVRDFLGAASFLGMYYTIDPRIICWSNASRRTVKYLLRAGSLVVLALAFISLASCSVAYILRDRAFPRICDFDSRWIDQFIALKGAKLSRIPPPAGWFNVNQVLVACLCFGEPGYSGITFEEPYPNWSDYRLFCLDVYSDRKDTVSLSLRIDDMHHDFAYNDRYNGALAVGPGLNRFRIPLETIKWAPARRTTDMKAIRRIILFTYQLRQPLTIYLDRFWLE